MAPAFNSGDLAVVRSGGTYQVGDVAAYRSDMFNTVVLHRIVAWHDGHYTFKGDHNSWVDPERPAPSQVLGKQVVRIPHGGAWMHRLASPAALGFFAFLVIGGGGASVERRRRRRGQKGTAMALSTRRQGGAAALATLTPKLQVAAAVTATIGLLALVLAASAWTAPVREVVTTDQPSGQQMTFAYSAPVRRTAAYDGTRAASPHPIFRRLANDVDVRYTYHGPPGRIAMKATLSTGAGWTSTVPLQAVITFSGRTYARTTRLHLSALQARADAAATATGLPSGQVLITLAPTVTSTTGTAFTPTLGLRLDPLALSLAGSPSSLVVKGASAAPVRTEALNKLSFLGIQLGVSAARTLSLALLMLSLFAAVAITMLARRTRPKGEVEEIRRRWSSLLVQVHPVQTPEGRPLVDVTEPGTLVKLAERYGLLILHWASDDVETYLVQDDAITYRYRASATHPTAPTRSSSASRETSPVGGSNSGNLGGEEVDAVPVEVPWARS
jgi:hypothetical protein